MAANSNGKMKKHEACYWLNKLIDEERSTIEYQKREYIDRTTVSYGEDEGKPLTEEQIEYNQKHASERIADCEKKLEALDIAASALTN